MPRWADFLTAHNNFSAHLTIVKNASTCQSRGAPPASSAGATNMNNNVLLQSCWMRALGE
jgi:hypothetical protein